MEIRISHILWISRAMSSTRQAITGGSDKYFQEIEQTMGIFVGYAVIRG